MRVIVIGAGEVGTTIAADLADDHEVVVIDIDRDRVEEITYSVDALAIEGDGTSLSTLEEAGVDETDILIASTDNDETNIVACSAAAVTGGVFTIARVKRPHLLDTWNRTQRAFGVDYMVCTDLLSAQMIVDIVGLPAAHDTDMFANDTVQLAEFEIPAGSSIAGQTVESADRFESLTFVGLLRNGDVEIARGDTLLEAGDYVVVIGSPGSVRGFAHELAPKEMESIEGVVIIGGSDIGYQTARLLGERGLKPRLIERDERRARTLAERLPNATVMQSDATDIEFLTREHVGDADVVIATLSHDEMNLLVALLAAHLGVSRTVALVENGAYVDLFETVGVDVAVNPREVAAEEITHFMRAGRTEKVSLVHQDRAEATEIEIDADSVLAGQSIGEAMTDLPGGVVVGAITRDENLITPRGDTVIETGDHVIVFAETERIEAVSTAI